MNQGELKQLEKHASLSDEQRKAILATRAPVERCLYLMPEIGRNRVVGGIGGWPRMPDEIEWPADADGKLHPFIGWIDVEHVSELLPEFRGTGRLLFFQGPAGMGSQSAIAVSSATHPERKPDRRIVWSNDALAQGQPFGEVTLKGVKGLSVRIDRGVDEANAEILASMRPAEAMGQIGGSLGRNDREARMRVFHTLHGQSILNDCDQRLLRADPKFLADGVKGATDFGINLDPIVDQYVRLKHFIDDHLKEWEQQAKERGIEWNKGVAKLLKKISNAVKKHEDNARAYFRGVAEMGSKIHSPLGDLLNLDEAGKASLDLVRDTSGYQEWFESKPLLYRCEPCLSIERATGELEQAGKTNDPEQIKSLAQRLFDLLGAHAEELPFDSWSFIIGANGCRVLNNMECLYSRENLENPGAIKLEQVSDALIWREELEAKEIANALSELTLGLALFDTCPWVGDEVSYHLRQSDLANSALEQIVIVDDYRARFELLPVKKRRSSTKRPKAKAKAKSARRKPLRSGPLLDTTKFAAAADKETGRPGLSQRVSPKDFYPIGEAVKPREKVEIFWLGTEIDEVWLGEILPDLAGLVTGIEKALGEYCGSEWCGADVKAELEEMLEGRERSRFKSEGHLPFIELQRVRFEPMQRVMVVDAACLVDYNLDEHGISIKFADGKWSFGYAGEWDD